MSSAGLPPGWLEYSTDSGEKYYFNTGTQETTWDRPQIPVAPAPAPKPVPVAAINRDVDEVRPAARMPFAGDIQKGVKLKKTVTRDLSSPVLTAAPTIPASAMSQSNAMIGSQLANIMSKGGDGGEKKGGGFAEIMRKNREAAAKKAAEAGTTSPVPKMVPVVLAATSSPYSSPLRQTAATNSPTVPAIKSDGIPPLLKKVEKTVPAKEPPATTAPIVPESPPILSTPVAVVSSTSSSSNNSSSGPTAATSPVLTASLETRLNRIEEKLDKILRHLNL